MAQIESNEKEISNLPSWINEDFFNNILARDNRKNVKLNSWHIKLAMGKGDNYASTIYRAEVTVEDEDNQIQELSYILKTAQGLEWQEQLDQNFNVFLKEFEMYNVVLPKINNILMENGDGTELAAKCILSSKSPMDHCVFDDLSKRGYRMANRVVGLDMDHMKVILLKLAKMHAASVCLYEKEGPYNQSLLESMYKDEVKPFFDMVSEQLTEVLCEVIESKWANGVKYAAKIKNGFKEAFDMGQKAFKSDENGFNVLNHGDLWTNNALFKYNERNEVEDVLFIDFQMPVWSSPAVDLWYFIISSAHRDIKIREMDTFVQYYHENLIESLKSLNYTGRLPPLMDLQIDMLKRINLGVIASTGVLPIAKLENCENAAILNFFENNENATNFKKQLYGNPKYVEEINLLMPFFEKKGGF